METIKKYKSIIITCVIILIIGIFGGIFLFQKLEDRDIDPTQKSNFENYLSKNYSNYKVKKIKNEVKQSYSGEEPGKSYKTGWLEADVEKNGERFKIIYKNDESVKTNIYLKQIEEDFIDKTLRSCNLPEWLIKDAKLLSLDGNPVYLSEDIKNFNDFISTYETTYYYITLTNTAIYNDDQLNALKELINNPDNFNHLIKYLNSDYKPFKIDISLEDNKKPGYWGGNFSIEIKKGNDNYSDNYVYISLSDANFNGIFYKIKANGEIVY